MATLKIIHYDLETTGADPCRHGVHEIGGQIEINGEIVQEFEFKVRPHPLAQINPKALEIGGVTIQQIMGYQDGLTIIRELCNMLDRYVDWSNPTDYFMLSGFNTNYFDDRMLEKFFIENGSERFRKYFFPGSIDTRVLAMNILRYELPGMPDFKLHTVAKRFGIDVDENLLHRAKYDATVSRLILDAINKR